MIARMLGPSVALGVAMALGMTSSSAASNAGAAETAQSIAERLRQAYAAGQGAGIETLSELFAPSVHVSHVPAHPSDGPYGRKALADGFRAEMGAARQAMPDYRFRILGITAGDGTIEVARVLEGTRGDGRKVHSEVRSVYTVEQGRITRLVAYLEGGAPPVNR